MEVKNYINEDDEDDGPVSDSDILPEIIKDDSFEGEFDNNQDTHFSSDDHTNSDD